MINIFASPILSVSPQHPLGANLNTTNHGVASSHVRGLEMHVPGLLLNATTCRVVLALAPNVAVRPRKGRAKITVGDIDFHLVFIAVELSCSAHSRRGSACHLSISLSFFTLHVACHG